MNVSVCAAEPVENVEQTRCVINYCDSTDRVRQYNTIPEMVPHPGTSTCTSTSQSSCCPHTRNKSSCQEDAFDLDLTYASQHNRMLMSGEHARERKVPASWITRLASLEDASYTPM